MRWKTCHWSQTPMLTREVCISNIRNTPLLGFQQVFPSLCFAGKRGSSESEWTSLLWAQPAWAHHCHSCLRDTSYGSPRTKQHNHLKNYLLLTEQFSLHHPLLLGLNPDQMSTYSFSDSSLSFPPVNWGPRWLSHPLLPTNYKLKGLGYSSYFGMQPQSCGSSCGTKGIQQVE